MLCNLLCNMLCNILRNILCNMLRNMLCNMLGYMLRNMLSNYEAVGNPKSTNRNNFWVNNGRRRREKGRQRQK